MDDPPFNVAAALDQEFRGRKEWREMMRAAEKLAQEMDSLLVSGTSESGVAEYVEDSSVR